MYVHCCTCVQANVRIILYLFVVNSHCLCSQAFPVPLADGREPSLLGRPRPPLKRRRKRPLVQSQLRPQVGHSEERGETLERHVGHGLDAVGQRRGGRAPVRHRMALETG